LSIRAAESSFLAPNLTYLIKSKLKWKTVRTENKKPERCWSFCLARERTKVSRELIETKMLEKFPVKKMKV
jgi:hypothetical protein